MKLSALTSSLPLELPAAIDAIADLGFRWIDVPPTADPDARERLRVRDLQVSCVGLEREQPENLDLASDDANVRQRSVAYYRQALDHTADLNSSVGYLTPPIDIADATLSRWTESLRTLADHARVLGIKICVEHFPGRALPTVGATLRFLDEMDHESLALLIDVGHCLISQEDAAAAVVESGERLGYLHFDDNDGFDDLHWALLDGRLTETQISAVVKAQRATNYDGALCIELNSSLGDPLENLRRSHQILQRCAAGS